MDYNLMPYLDNKAKEMIANINKKLDYIMDELFFGKKLTYDDIDNDRIILNKIKDEYYELLLYEKNDLNNDASLLSKHASKSFILLALTTFSIYLTPLMVIPSIISFNKLMKYFLSYKALTNDDIIAEYLSTFDNILKRILNYEEVLNKKYLDLYNETLILKK